MWVERYLIVVSGFRVPLLAYSPANYAPTWVEWSILAGAFALFMFIISVFAKLIPVVSVWEVVEHRGPEPGMIAPNHGGTLMPLPVSGGESISMRYSLRISRVITVLVVAFLLAVVVESERALAAGEPTAISIGAPEAANLGDNLTLQARLVDGTGAPIAKALIVFTSPASFLDAEGDVAVTQAITNADGLAVATWQARRNGDITINAEFRGDDRYASATATAQLAVTGSQQLYTDHIGIQIPGLNAGVGSNTVPGTSRFWPTLSGWPIGGVITVIWSLYGLVVVLIFRIAGASPHAGSDELPPMTGEAG